MWLLLIMLFLSPFIVIGYLVARLDRFLAGGGIVKDEVEVHPAAIVFGQSSLAQEVTKILHKNKVRVFTIQEPFILAHKDNVQFLFALSENDADNLVLCKIGKRIYGIEKAICLCNEQINKRLFGSEKISFLSGEEATACLFYQTVLHKAEVKP
ncbi:MAG TPA: hypothetical protein VFC74_09710 [Oscillospiraceae bacterium]|nr:hypothetical protein [Oscillospiraceae bacterium]